MNWVVEKTGSEEDQRLSGRRSPECGVRGDAGVEWEGTRETVRHGYQNVESGVSARE